MTSVSVVVLGNSGVGKTTMLSRIVDHVEMSEHLATIGTDTFSVDVVKLPNGKMFRKPTEIKGEHYRLQLYDTGGDTRFQQIADSYIRQFKHFLICFWEPSEIHRWLAVIKRYHKLSECMVVLLSTKSDLRQTNKVEFQKRYLRETNRYLTSFLFFETSVQDQRNAHFHILLETLLREYITNYEGETEDCAATYPVFLPKRSFCFCL